MCLPHLLGFSTIPSLPFTIYVLISSSVILKTLEYLIMFENNKTQFLTQIIETYGVFIVLPKPFICSTTKGNRDATPQKSHTT